MKRKLYRKPSNEDSFAALATTKFNDIASLFIGMKASIEYLYMG